MSELSTNLKRTYLDKLIFIIEVTLLFVFIMYFYGYLNNINKYLSIISLVVVFAILIWIGNLIQNKAQTNIMLKMQIDDLRKYNLFTTVVNTVIMILVVGAVIYYINTNAGIFVGVIYLLIEYKKWREYYIKKNKKEPEKIEDEGVVVEEVK